MPGTLSAQSSLFASSDIFVNLPAGPYHTSDDTSDDDSVLALDEVPDYLKKNTNKDNPIAIDSSSEDDTPQANQAGPSRRKRTTADLSDHGSPRTLRSSQKSKDDDEDRHNKRKRSNTADSSQVTQDVVIADIPSSPEAGPSTPKSYLAEDHLTRVIEILPDIDSEWALRAINEEMILRPGVNPANRVVEIALEMEGGYPRLKENKKGKDEDTNPLISGQENEYKDPAYRSQHRFGPAYYARSMAQLEQDFPSIPTAHLRHTYISAHSAYVPAYLRLLEHTKLEPKPYSQLKRPRNVTRVKTKATGLSYSSSQASEQASSGSRTNGEGPLDGIAEEFDKELNWLHNHLVVKAEKLSEEEARRIATEEALAAGGGIECGCCFGETLLEDMIQCNEGHLFCCECATQHAETKLGEQSVSILCMDQSDCTSPFPDSELARLLSVKSLDLYHRLKQAKDLEQAEIEGLESCPSCPFAAVIDNPNEKLFRCMNKECGQVTCRGCRRKEHIPRTCAEVEADLKLNNRHTVEDAMSEALIRHCPKCAKPYIKESGCNKIHCSKCGTMSCYICQKAVQGYQHFDQDPREYGQGKKEGKCVLWDSEEHHQDAEAVRRARDTAAAEVLAAAQAGGIALNAADLNVDLPDPFVRNQMYGGNPMVNAVRLAGGPLPPAPALAPAPLFNLNVGIRGFASPPPALPAFNGRNRNVGPLHIVDNRQRVMVERQAQYMRDRRAIDEAYQDARRVNEREDWGGNLRDLAGFEENERRLQQHMDEAHRRVREEMDNHQHRLQNIQPAPAPAPAPALAPAHAPAPDPALPGDAIAREQALARLHEMDDNTLQRYLEDEEEDPIDGSYHDVDDDEEEEEDAEEIGTTDEEELMELEALEEIRRGRYTRAA
ncbi:uncharacterized protein I303_102448 [Kwoniella dejecticola CBS 10117]|uniref:E3 ubiquitin-protein ligase RNF216 n=1 Tax=Kwoniella dejecticola CBS 10117 TaxID=1296121 RepID=A0A1A6A8S1_9TREE|nr:E3 ubiquitin-protein ligase RNF216 [Kwoniella dejecticola CBS 10117]OBR86456.1 E3 ubiquitin-protein ligase RNF216 [Kwoniella dejecticola CBS 10117]